MKFQWCFCFKRSRASYNLSSDAISYTNTPSITAIVTTPPIPLSPVSSIKPTDENVVESINDRQIDTADENLTLSTSTDVIFRQSPQVICEDDGELYATVDKTKQAKNAIRIQTDTDFPPLKSTGSRQLVHFRNVRISDQRPQSLPPLNNTSIDKRMHSYDSIPDHQQAHYDHLKPIKSLSHSDEYSKIGRSQLRPHSFVYGQRDTVDSSHLYTEIGNDSASGTVNRNRRPYVSTWRPLNDEIDDTASGTYATIDELDSNKTQRKQKHFFHKH